MQLQRHLPSFDSHSKTEKYIFEYFKLNHNTIPHLTRFIFIGSHNSTLKLFQDLADVIEDGVIYTPNTVTFENKSEPKSGGSKKYPTMIIGKDVVIRPMYSDFGDYSSYDKDDKLDKAREITYIIYHVDNFNIKPIQDKIEEAHNSIPHDTHDPEIFVIKRRDNGFCLQDMPVKSMGDDIFNNYNDDFKEVYEKMIKKLSDGGKGLFLLHGGAGGGKTSIIKHIATEKTVKRKLIFLPPNLTNHLSAPEFIDFMINNKGSCLIIEEAENILMKRQGGSSQEMANLLNITDGMLSDILDIAIICTFNSKIDEIDPALRRKGRLTLAYEFKALNESKTNALALKLGYPEPNKEMMLTDIYNMDEEAQAAPQRKAIGFFN